MPFARLVIFQIGSAGRNFTPPLSPRRSGFQRFLLSMRAGLAEMVRYLCGLNPLEIPMTRMASFCGRSDSCRNRGSAGHRRRWRPDLTTNPCADRSQADREGRLETDGPFQYAVAGWSSRRVRLHSGRAESWCPSSPRRAPCFADHVPAVGSDRSSHQRGCRQNRHARPGLSGMRSRSKIGIGQIATSSPRSGAFRHFDDELKED
jgi:hypothetical protein